MAPCGHPSPHSSFHPSFTWLTCLWPATLVPLFTCRTCPWLAPISLRASHWQRQQPHRQTAWVVSIQRHLFHRTFGPSMVTIVLSWCLTIVLSCYSNIVVSYHSIIVVSHYLLMCYRTIVLSCYHGVLPCRGKVTRQSPIISTIYYYNFKTPSNSHFLSPFFFAGIKCPVCNKFVLPDDIECHLVMCLTKPRLSYNGMRY